MTHKRLIGGAVIVAAVIVLAVVAVIMVIIDDIRNSPEVRAVGESDGIPCRSGDSRAGLALAA